MARVHRAIIGMAAAVPQGKQLPTAGVRGLIHPTRANFAAVFSRRAGAYKAWLIKYPYLAGNISGLAQLEDNG
ncbi:hypothetical protein KCP74_21610 [Salmonella enterica subsp. enterica]|nr:hypothetical protein KCP74_21610 [Salmonella enterica subsp. enterica]